VLAAASLLALAALAWQGRGLLTLGTGAPAAQPERTIAVLPFVDLSPGRDQAYFSDGLAEELLNALTRVPALRVTARASSFQFRSENRDFRAIGRRLNVASVLDGSVRRDAQRVRIAVRLVSAEDGFQRWSATYERQLDDVFAVQEEIARSVVAALRIALQKGAAASTPWSQPKHAEAYTAYLQGRHFYARRSKEDLDKAAAYYSKAIEIDSGYAAAWVGLAEVHHRQADNGYLPIDEGYRMARREVERALDFDPNLAWAHSELGWIKRAHEWDWQGAEAAHQRALALDPGSLSATIGAAVLAFNLGRLDEAISLDNRAIRLDPLSLGQHVNLGIHLYYAGRQEEAAAALMKVLELNPEFPITRVLLGRVLLARGEIQPALGEMERESDPVWRLYGLCLAYHAAGRVKDADATLAAFIKDHGDTMAFQIAETFAFRGRVDEAFEWLDRAFAQRDGGMADIKNNPLLRPLLRDARYAKLLNRMRLPE
jgi:TolB-like protein/predicted Zn-dependent protease